MTDELVGGMFAFGRRWGYGPLGVTRMKTRVGALAVAAVLMVIVETATAAFVQQGARLTGRGEISTSLGGEFGSSVALSADGNTALIGAPSDNAELKEPFSGTGAAWVFTRSGSRWTQGPKLRGMGEAGHAEFGISVALSADGSTALIGGWLDHGAKGAAWVFTRSGATWTQQGPKLTARGEGGAGTFGESVALSADGNTALIGANNDSNRGDLRGAAWLFTRRNGVWAQQGGKLIGRGERGEGNFGISVSLSADGNTALVGANEDRPKPGHPVPTGVGAA
jgi:phage gpG-like protein